MTTRFCYVCDSAILKGEPRIYIDNLSIHEYCDIDSRGVPFCDNELCADRWLVHAGPCRT